MKSLRLPLCLLITSIVFCSCDGNAGNEYGYGYNDWDENKDGLLEPAEVEKTWSDARYYDTYDRDTSAFLDREEWNEVVREHYADQEEEYGDELDFDKWDTNQDEKLDADELSEGTFTLWDRDGDGTIEVVEYRDFN